MDSSSQPDVQLDLLKFRNRLRIRSEGDQRFVFDQIRKKWIAFTSEEFVRQLFIRYLILEKGFPRSRISVEKEIIINGLPRRYDLAVFSKAMNPILLVECKSPAVSLDQPVFDQAIHYNMEMNVQFLLLTNGTKTYCCSVDHMHRRLIFHAEIPDYRSLDIE